MSERHHRETADRTLLWGLKPRSKHALARDQRARAKRRRK